MMKQMSVKTERTTKYLSAWSTIGQVYLIRWLVLAQFRPGLRSTSRCQVAGCQHPTRMPSISAQRTVCAT